MGQTMHRCRVCYNIVECLRQPQQSPSISSRCNSGDWLHALPLSCCGLRLDDESIRVAVGLRLGINLCEPPECPCGALVDARGTHGLSCKRSTGRTALLTSSVTWHPNHPSLDVLFYPLQNDQEVLCHPQIDFSILKHIP